MVSRISDFAWSKPPTSVHATLGMRGAPIASECLRRASLMARSRSAGESARVPLEDRR